MSLQRSCSKCESWGIKVQWRGSNLDLGRTEHLLLTCNRCGYSWQEPTCDSHRADVSRRMNDEKEPNR